MRVTRGQTATRRPFGVPRGDSTRVDRAFGLTPTPASPAGVDDRFGVVEMPAPEPRRR
jgi:hypothetical protein